MAMEFSLVPGKQSMWLQKNTGGPPPNAVCLAHQHDHGPLYLGVADTQWGRIPGKASGGTCWFPYAGEENPTNNFFWVCSTNPMKLKKKDTMPGKALQSGYQSDGAGPLFHAVAHTPYGTIPGKTVHGGGTCWYAYGGKEHPTSDFSYVVWKPH